MIPEEKIKQIKKQLRRGEPEGEIRTGLQAEGYTEDEIAEAFNTLFAHARKQGKTTKPRHKQGQVLILAGACLIITGISIQQVESWLQEFGIPAIVLGGLCLVAGYFVKGKQG